MHREVLLAHSNALPDKVVLVSTKLSFQTDQLPFIGLLGPRHPFHILVSGLSQAEHACEMTKSFVQLNIFALLGLCESKRDTVLAKRRTMSCDVR
jgi:hypothetical protein